MHSPHELHVTVVSPEEADHGAAEFWIGGDLFGFTRIEDGQIILWIQPSADGGPIRVNAHSLATALLQAKDLLSGTS
jgi:hypothetical protein